MANIQPYLDNITNAEYGEEVRGSICDAIEVINEELEPVSDQVLQDKNFTWEQGQIAFTNGAPVNHDARIRTVSSITKRDAIEVVCSAEYNFFVFAWENGTYVGCLKADDTFSTGSANAIAKTSFVLDNYPDYGYKFVLKKTSGDAASPSDGVNCVYHGSQIVVLQNEVSAIDERINNIQISKDLTIVNMGDSIFGNFRSPTDISTFLEGITGAKCYNVAFGGTRAVARSATSTTADRRPFDLTVLAHSICTGDFTEQDAVIESIGGIYVEHLDTLKQIDFSTVDILTLSYGTNDYAGNNFVGDVSSGINTYAGALNSAANELLQAFPNLRIVFCTPIFRMMENGSDMVPADVYQNSNGNTLIDFVVAAENVAKNIHSFAVNNYYMGVNAENYSQYYTDTTHPNEKMRKLIAANLAYNLFGGHEGANIDSLKMSINDIQTDVYTFTGNKRIETWIDGAYIATNTSVVDPTPVSASAWRYTIIPCSPGDKFTITVRGGNVPRPWAFIDSNNNVLSVAPVNATLLDTTITAPDNTVKLVLNDTDKTGICFTNQSVVSLADDNRHRIDRIVNGNVIPIGTNGRTHNGVIYTTDGAGNYIADGTASSTSYYLIYNNISKLPEFFIPGESYFCDYWSNDLYITINVLAYKSDGTNESILDTAAPKSFTVPLDAVGMVIRIKIGTGHIANNRLIAPKMYATKSLGGVSYKQGKNCDPMLTIIYDDGHSDFNTYIMPIIRAKNIPIATAVVPEAIGQSGYSMLMDWDTIKACYLDGAEVLTHFNTYSESEWIGFGTQQISARYYKSLNAIRAHGIYTPNALVFSGSSSRYPVSRAAAHRVFVAGFNASNGGINYYGEFDPWFINRYGSDNQTLETLKGWIDDLVSAKTGWMVWTRHNSNATSEDPATAAQMLSDAIDYALSLGVQIVTVERGLAEYLDIT